MHSPFLGTARCGKLVRVGPVYARFISGAARGSTQPATPSDTQGAVKGSKAPAVSTPAGTPAGTPGSSTSSSTPSGPPRVVLKGGKAKLFSEFQSPTVYGGAVDRVVGRPAPKTGDVVLVCDGAETPIGWGIYNPNSMFRVRLMQLADEVDEAELQQPDFEQLLHKRLQQAVLLRQRLGLPSEQTNVYRLCNSEGDRLSGLIVDVLADHMVVASSAAWAES
ncbi:hypothetical protein N2152v2_007185 [Parachlorella kessleri]